MSENTKALIDSLPTGYLSVSQIQTFLQCGYKYFYRYIASVKSAPSLPLIFGKAGHKALEKNCLYKLETGKDLSELELIELFNAEFDARKVAIEDWQGRSESEVKLQGAELLSYFLRHSAGKLKPYVDGIEKHIRTEVAGIPIIGYIDFVGEVEAAPSVVDHKFVGRPKTEKQAREDMQLTFYSLASGVSSVAFLCFIKPHPKYHPEAKVSLVSGGKRTEKDYKKFEGIVRSVAKQIYGRDFRPARRGDPLCSKQYCEFWHQCPGGGAPGAPKPSRLLEKELATNGPGPPQPPTLQDILRDEAS